MQCKVTAAATPTCKAQVTDKKPAGAVLNSFMKKRETIAACDAAAVRSTAAVIDAVGSQQS